MSAGPDDLKKKVFELARATEAPEESFLMRRLSLDDADQVQSVIDGLTLSLISFCYHRHPRGENVHEVMEMLEPMAEISRLTHAAGAKFVAVVCLNTSTHGGSM